MPSNRKIAEIAETLTPLATLNSTSSSVPSNYCIVVVCAVVIGLC
jgi:hypothetical protein